LMGVLTDVDHRVERVIAPDRSQTEWSRDGNRQFILVIGIRSF
jgi:hypothetical protein